MALIIKDRVKETTTATGTGQMVLDGASTGFQSFSAIGEDNQTYYTIVGGSQWEVGLGTIGLSGSFNQLTRETVLSNSLGTTAFINFSAGTKDVFCTYPAGKAVLSDTSVTGSTGSGALVLSTNPAIQNLTATGTMNLTGDSLNAQNIATAQTSNNLTIGGTGQTTGTISIGGTSATGAINLGQSTEAQTVNIATGINTASAKIVNIGTAGTGSTTRINIGSTSGSVSTTVVNGTFSMTGADRNIVLNSSQTTGTISAGGASGTGTITLGQSTDTQTVNIATGVPASTKTKSVNIGTSATTAAGTTNIAIGSTTGTSTTTLNGINKYPTLTASQAVFTNASKNLVSVATTGTGSVVLSDSPTFTSNIVVNDIKIGKNSAVDSTIVGNTRAIPYNGNPANTVVGYQALEYDSSSNGGNTVVGAYAFSNNQQGIDSDGYNTIIGANCLTNSLYSDFTVAVGANITANPSNLLQSNCVYVGQGITANGYLNEIVIGSNLTGRGNNTTSIGNSQSITYLSLVIIGQGFTVATLPSTSATGQVIGARCFVTNALAPAFGSTVVGGGSAKVPVYYDGTSWKVG